MKQFEKFGLSQELLVSIEDMGIKIPTQIQGLSIPSIMQGKDVIGESATGSGKTLVFGCGIAEKVIPGQGLQALILTPTRELAEQVKDNLKQLTKKLKIMTVYGGVSISPQIDNLRNADVVVATPGRLLDHFQRRTVNTSRVKILVLDEADRMFDMGFIEDVERIISHCPKKRQTMFFSATISDRVKKLGKRHMLNPSIVAAKNQVDPAKLKQVYYVVDRGMKLSLLIHLLNQEKSGLVMVFCNTRRTTDFIVKNLKVNGANAVAIHGGLSQNKRTNTIEKFNNAEVGVLVCTDIASRGLHIDNVSHIYNFDIPKDAKDYVHRIGRTARAGEEGKAVNILADVDYDNFSRVMREYRDFNIKCEEMPFVKRIISVNPSSKRNNFNRRRYFNRRRPN